MSFGEAVVGGLVPTSICWLDDSSDTELALCNWSAKSDRLELLTLLSLRENVAGLAEGAENVAVEPSVTACLKAGRAPTHAASFFMRIRASDGCWTFDDQPKAVKPLTTEDRLYLYISSDFYSLSSEFVKKSSATKLHNTSRSYG